ncbi:L-xylulose reductase [Condylostylus longicornis]|uniref:L-xylulose reductase n=1 Tax=Condylostylus longicornis TaxID=2530218 RepID=UPI00244E4FFD|nr:L-xylulose reductase [Condylostylus longicornis]
MDLKNKTILVTGAGQGIGNAICKSLYDLEVNVIAVSRTLQNLELLKQECPKIQVIQVDLNDWNGTRDALCNVNSLDGLVNNAGVAYIKPFSELTEEDFDNTFNVNIKAVFNVTQTLLPSLKNGSSIVNVSSLASSRSFFGHSAYSATKAALDSLTKSLALELGERKIRVNSVNPTVIMTEMGKANWSSPSKANPVLNHIPLKRFGEVNEVVNSVIFLLSDKSSYINGHHLLLEGGYCVS